LLGTRAISAASSTRSRYHSAPALTAYAPGETADWWAADRRRRPRQQGQQTSRPAPVWVCPELCVLGRFELGVRSTVVEGTVERRLISARAGMFVLFGVGTKLAGVALYTGTRAYNFEDRLHVMPIDRICAVVIWTAGTGELALSTPPCGLWRVAIGRRQSSSRKPPQRYKARLHYTVGLVK
jgi:hypothetical protein